MNIIKKIYNFINNKFKNNKFKNNYLETNFHFIIKNYLLSKNYEYISDMEFPEYMNSYLWFVFNNHTLLYRKNYNDYIFTVEWECPIYNIKITKKLKDDLEIFTNYKLNTFLFKYIVTNDKLDDIEEMILHNLNRDVE